MESQAFSVEQSKRGSLINLQLKKDKTNMNWVIDPDYLKSLNYDDEDKLFGEFTITFNGKTYNSSNMEPSVNIKNDQSRVVFTIDGLKLRLQYWLVEDRLVWNISLLNETNEKIEIENFGIWTSLAYVMFRDTNVHRNANQSTAVFPSISPNFTKLAAVRRDNTNPNLGLYQTKGVVRSVGTFNEYSNRFFENVSPSLDGMLFHQIILAGGYPQANGPKNDWIYSQNNLVLAANKATEWEFTLTSFEGQRDFYDVGASCGHPKIDFLPSVSNRQQQRITLDAESSKNVESIMLNYKQSNQLKELDLTSALRGQKLTFDTQGLGEHKVTFLFKSGKRDMIVFNVVSSVKQLLRDRANYISEHSYAGAAGKYPYSFGPVSNQGESLGKMTFILQECLLDEGLTDKRFKIQQVEESAVKYVRPKWFVNGNFKKPQNLYGNFYRVMDLEYIAHLFYLLSQCDQSDLKLNSPKEYLKWAAQVFDVRVNPDLHDNERGKAEAQMLGQYFLYIDDLLKDLKDQGLEHEYKEISASWQSATQRIAQDSASLSAAMTEHFFDNAGFGPAAGALALSGHKDAARVYGELLKANIGFSNDFRSQSPDRWWESLSYMVHALWGGVTAASALMTGKELRDPELLEAAYRSTVAVLYMYDSNATATDRILKPGEAASTYSIAGPNLNRPDLSRNRFGQSIFASDGGIFSRLFPDGYTGEDDWDMGEELVAYLNGFGQETYVYENKGKVHVVNGQATLLDDDIYQIESFAPYPKRYINLNDGNSVTKYSDKIKFSITENNFLN